MDEKELRRIIRQEIIKEREERELKQLILDRNTRKALDEFALLLTHQALEANFDKK